MLRSSVPLYGRGKRVRPLFYKIRISIELNNSVPGGLVL
jgi:hypothetical protein